MAQRGNGLDVQFGKAKRGEAVEYHTGLLMRDRQTDQNVHWRGWYAMDRHKAGEAALVQERITDGKCRYWMVKL